HPFFMLFMFVFAFSFDENRIFGDIDLHIVLVQARQVRGNDKLSVVFENIHVRRECLGRAPRTEAFACSTSKTFKHSIYVVKESTHHAKRAKQGPRLHSRDLACATWLDGLILFSVL